MKKYKIISIFNLLNQIELIDVETKKIFYLKHKKSVNNFKRGDIIYL